jgi:hypothetical protein
MSPPQKMLNGAPDGVLNSARARIMSGVGHLVEHRRLDFRPVTADIGAELVYI